MKEKETDLECVKLVLELAKELLIPTPRQFNCSKEEALMHFNKCKYNPADYRNKTNG